MNRSCRNIVSKSPPKASNIQIKYIHWQSTYKFSCGVIILHSFLNIFVIYISLLVLPNSFRSFFFPDCTHMSIFVEKISLAIVLRRVMQPCCFTGQHVNRCAVKPLVVVGELQNLLVLSHFWTNGFQSILEFSHLM